MTGKNSGCEDTRKADIGKKELSDTCDECKREGLHYVSLRICLSCGNVGCCDSSPGKHATKHFKQSKHPVIAEFPGRRWMWCYAHGAYGY